MTLAVAYDIWSGDSLKPIFSMTQLDKIQYFQWKFYLVAYDAYLDHCLPH